MGNESSKPPSSSEDELGPQQLMSKLVQPMGASKGEKMKQAKEILDAYIKSGKREHLSLELSRFLLDKYAKDEFCHFSEDPVQAAGTEWKLVATKHKDKAALFLSLMAKSTLECPIRFELDYSFRLSNVDPSKDIRKAGKESLPLKFLAGSEYLEKLLFHERLIKEIDIKDLVDPKGGFLHEYDREGFVREGGTIHMELDFTIVSAKVDSVPDEQEGAASSSKK